MEIKDVSFPLYLQNVEMQISEVDMVQSMYPKSGEFVMDDPSVLADMRDLLDGKSSPFPIRKLEYAVNTKNDEIRYEMYCTLPPDYPTMEPEIYARCSSLTREQQHQLNKDLSAFVSGMERGELCIGPVLQWLQEHIQSYAVSNANASPPLPRTETELDNTDFGRFWIYSHHIYNKGKRKTILELSKELDVTGFCLPGKPGIICAEGLSSNCEEFWNRIQLPSQKVKLTRLKHMNWKKILCKQQECISCGVGGIEELRRFTSFEEVAFEKHRTNGRDFHTDMGEFLKYLEIHDCGYVFKDYFGIGNDK